MKVTLQTRIFYLVSVLMVSSMVFLAVFLLDTLKNRMSDEFRKEVRSLSENFRKKLMRL